MRPRSQERSFVDVKSSPRFGTVPAELEILTFGPSWPPIAARLPYSVRYWTPLIPAPASSASSIGPFRTGIGTWIGS